LQLDGQIRLAQPALISQSAYGPSNKNETPLFHCLKISTLAVAECPQNWTKCRFRSLFTLPHDFSGFVLSREQNRSTAHISHSLSRLPPEFGQKSSFIFHLLSWPLLNYEQSEFHYLVSFFARSILEHSFATVLQEFRCQGCGENATTFWDSKPAFQGMAKSCEGKWGSASRHGKHCQALANNGLI
jgi:hypothetical protein